MSMPVGPQLDPTTAFGASDRVSQNYVPVGGGPAGPVSFASEDDDLVVRLAHVALRVVDELARTISHSLVRPVNQVAPDVVDPDHPGAPSTWTDAYATRRIVRYVQDIPGVGALFVGEEFGVTTISFEEHDLVLMVDSVDGTSVLEEIHGMGAVVIVAGRRTRQGWERLGGAIGLLDVTRSVIYWNGAGHVSQMRYEGSEVRIGPVLEVRPGKVDTFAAVAASEARAEDHLDLVRRLGARRSHTVGGNPLLGALLAGQIGGLIEPVPQRPYDAAYLLPALHRGCRAIWLSNGEDLVVADFWAGFEAYMHDTAGRPRTVAPFAVFSNIDLLRRTRDLVVSMA